MGPTSQRAKAAREEPGSYSSEHQSQISTSADTHDAPLLASAPAASRQASPTWELPLRAAGQGCGVKISCESETKEKRCLVPALPWPYCVL